MLHQLGEPEEEPLAEGGAGRVERARGPLHDAADLVLGVEVGPHNGLWIDWLRKRVEERG